MKNKILFLDVDGVLNNDDWAWEMYNKHHVKVYKNNILYQPAIVQLKRIINETGAKIILSSSWRRFPKAREDLSRWLDMCDLSIDSDTPILSRYAANRGDAISEWFKNHPGEYAYVILDDKDNMGEHISHLVQTSFFTGLTEEEANQCIAMLNNDDE